MASRVGALPAGKRERLGAWLESWPFCAAVFCLTALDVALFVWQVAPATSAATARHLRVGELAISAIFVGELGLRCYAHDRAALLYPANVFDAAVVVAAFALAAVQVSTPLLAARAARLIRYGAASARFGRAARQSSARAAEMTAILGPKKPRANAGAAAAARRAQKDEEGVVPLFLDATATADLLAALPLASQPPAKGGRSNGLPLLGALSAHARQPPQRLRDELGAASALRQSHAAAAAQRREGHVASGHVDAAPADAAGTDSGAGDVEAAGPRPRRTATSAKGLTMLLEHCAAQHAANSPTPLRIRDHLAGLQLVFLNDAL